MLLKRWSKIPYGSKLTVRGKNDLFFLAGGVWKSVFRECGITRREVEERYRLAHGGNGLPANWVFDDTVNWTSVHPPAHIVEANPENAIAPDAALPASPLNPTAVSGADKKLSEMFPELKGRKLTMSASDLRYRRIWMSLYRARAGGAAPPPPPASPPPPVAQPEERVVEYNLAEFVEVIDQGGEKWVKGAAKDAVDASAFVGQVDRVDKDGANYKQYINVSKDVEGRAKRHPEYGRLLLFRARVKQKDGLTDKLSGVKVRFSFTRVDGPERTNPGGADPNIWKGADLTGTLREGFGTPDGQAIAFGPTDSRGWTGLVTFYLSLYGGDQFEIKAELSPDTPGAAGAAALTTNAKYIVWRRFWYQRTYATGFNPPQPAAAQTAYAEVFAEMLEANTKVFVSNDLPVDLRDRTFLKEYMLSAGGANSDVAAIGAHNKLEFAKMMTNEKEHPFKAHLIACEYQCDPAGPCQLGVFALTANGDAVTLTQGSGGSVVSKPALKAGSKLVVVGEWSSTLAPWHKGGNIGDASIDIDSGRVDTMEVKVDLSKSGAGIPVPTPANPVYIRLQVHTCEGYLGESFGRGQVLCVYRPAAAAGSQGSEVDFNDTIAHEIGHMWSQTPGPGRPGPMADHPLYYVGHGGQGPHCRHGAAVAAGAVNWEDATELVPTPNDGDCIMYHSYSAACGHKFCKTCKPYLQLQDMSFL